VARGEGLFLLYRSKIKGNIEWRAQNPPQTTENKPEVNDIKESGAFITAQPIRGRRNAEDKMQMVLNTAWKKEGRGQKSPVKTTTRPGGREVQRG